MNSLITAIELNNRGAQQVANGRGTVGLACLTKSIKLFKQNLERASTTEQQQQQQQGGAAVEGIRVNDDSSSVDESSASSLCSDILIEIPGFDQDNQTDYIFNHAVAIPQSRGIETRSTTPSESDLQACSATVIYNLALEHHRRAISSEESCDRAICFIKAEKLYSMVIQLMQSQDAGSASDSIAQMSLLVHLAAQNNLAQLDLYRGNFEEAQQGLFELSLLLQSASAPYDACYQSMVNEALMNEPQVHGLLMNVLFFRSPRMAAAA